MFRERYLIRKGPNALKHGGGSSQLDDVIKAMDPTETKVQTYQDVLHDNATTGPWNSDRIAKAQEVSMKISDEINDHRKKLKKVFWDMPKEAGQNLASMLGRAAFVFPAWLWSKTTQLPGNLAKLITSGLTVITAHTMELLDEPARLMIKANNKYQNVIGMGGGGHGMPAPAH